MGLEAPQDLPAQAGGLRRGLAHLDARGFQGLLLGGRGTRRAGDDGTGVAHRLAFWRGESRDIADDRLGHVRLDVVGGTFFSVAGGLADYHDDLWVGVLL